MRDKDVTHMGHLNPPCGLSVLRSRGLTPGVVRDECYTFIFFFPVNRHSDLVFRFWSYQLPAKERI